MNNFTHLFDTYNWDAAEESIYSKTAADVIQALANPHPSMEDFKALLSPAAAPYLEAMAQRSRAITLQRFGNTMQLYAPLYLSNECHNVCTYCGFSMHNQVKRRTLSATEILQEAMAIKNMGYDHVLLVTGEANNTVHVDYFLRALTLLKPIFSQISMEVQPLEEEEYALLIQSGLHAVLVYQETYHKEEYKKHHPKGKKSNFYNRLETPDRLGSAGIHKMGLGVLIGLENWRTDSFFTALHLQYLQRRYWRTRYSISFPRLRPFSGGMAPKAEMSNSELVQLICAYRICFQQTELSLSTRETPEFRNHAIHLGITSISAGSKTNPGGYVVAPESLEQFEISDERSPAEVAAMLSNSGYEPVWKDWDKNLQ